MSAGNTHRRAMIFRSRGFTSLLSDYTVQERWTMDTLGPYNTTPGSIPDTFGNSDDTRDNTFNFDRTGLTFSYQNEPIAKTGSIGSFGMLHQDGSLGVARVDLASISSVYNCNGVSNPWTFFIFLKIVVTGDPTGSSGGISASSGGGNDSISYNFDTNNWMWTNGASDTGIAFANGNTNMIAWVGESSNRKGYIFNGGNVVSRTHTNDSNLGAGSPSSNYTPIACAYQTSFNTAATPDYAQTFYQDAIILSQALSQTQLQELYDAATK